MILSPENNEKTVFFETVEVTGDAVCSEYISVDRKQLRFDAPTEVIAKIIIPSYAFSDSNLECAVDYSTPASGYVKGVLRAPIYLNVSGQPRPVVTKVPTTMPTLAQTQAQTMVPATIEAKVPVTQVPAEPVTERWGTGIVAMGILALGLLISSAIVIVYDANRGRKKR